MVGWLIGVAEVSIVLGCMGHPVTVAEALVIESLLQAVRGAAFAIPSALGAQEAGPGPAVRHIRNSARSGAGVVAGQAGCRSRARSARPCCTANPGRRASDGKHSPPRTPASNVVRASIERPRHDMILYWLIDRRRGRLRRRLQLSDRSDVLSRSLPCKTSSPRRASMPGVTILKPLHGAEPGLLENLTSFCAQNYSVPFKSFLACRTQGMTRH